MTREVRVLRKTPVWMQGIRLRPDVTEQVDRLLHSNRPERFLDEWRLTTAGLESTLDRSDIAPEFDKDRFICDLVAAHRETALYVIESLSASVWSMVAGELLLVVPAGKLRPFGVAVVAYSDDRPSGLQMFVGRRDNEAGRQWMLLDRAAEAGMAFETDATLQALHPVLGSLHRAFIHEPEHRWTERSHRFLAAADCQHLGINPEWRPR